MASFCWHLFPEIILRKTGFAFDLLETLYCPKSVEGIHQLLEIERKHERLQEQLSHMVWSSRSNLPPEVKSAIRRMERAISRRQPIADTLPPEIPVPMVDLVVQWNDQLKEGQRIREEAQAVFDDELYQARQKLRQIVSNERFQEAIFLNSMTMYSNGLLPYLKNQMAVKMRKKQRNSEQKLMFYLQRFCAKNDTASFFGPMNYGRFRPGMDKNIDYRVVDGRYPPERRVLLSYWAAEALMQAMVEDPRLLVERKPIRSALIMLKEKSIFLPDLGREVSLDIFSLTILRLSDARTSLRAMSQMIVVPVDLLVERVQHLEACQLLKLDLPLARYPVDPLQAVEESVREFAPGEAKGEWEEIIGRFRSYLQAFEVAPLPERFQLYSALEHIFTEVVGLEPRRGQGQLYSDRFLFNENTSGDVADFVVGGRLYQQLVTRLQAPLNLLASYALTLCHGKQRQGWSQLQTILPLTKEPSRLLNLYLQACTMQEDEGIEESVHLSWKEQWQRMWTSLLATQVDQVATLSKVEIEQAMLELEALEGERLLVGPDIMIAAEDREAIVRGDYKIVLSEVHPLLLPTHKDLSLFHPNLAESLKQARILLDHLTYPQQEMMFASRRISVADSWPIGRPTIHCQWVRGDIGTLPVPIADITVDISTPETSVFRVPGLDGPCIFALPLFIEKPFPAFLLVFTRAQIWAVPIVKERRTPRIEIDGIVLQRERWDLGAIELPQVKPPFDSFETFLALWRWKQAWGMPDQVFFRPETGKETKPILVDFISPLSCLSALKMFARSQGGTFTEMLPRPDQLWLQYNGQRYTSELRFSAFRMPEAFHLGEARSLFQSYEPVQTAISEQLKRELAHYLEQGSPFNDTTLNELVGHLRFVQQEVETLIPEE